MRREGNVAGGRREERGNTHTRGKRATQTECNQIKGKLNREHIMCHVTGNTVYIAGFFRARKIS